MRPQRELKDAMRVLVDETLEHLAYNIGLWGIRFVDFGTHTVGWHRTDVWGHHHHNESHPHITNWFAGDQSDYSKPFIKSTQTTDNGVVFEYRPVKHAGNGGDPVIRFSNFQLNDITDFDVEPAKTIPQGPPSSKEYHLTNDRPDPTEEEFEVETTKEVQKEQSFGWLVSAEFEESVRVSGGVGVNAEVSATLRQRLEAHGDRRWQETFNERDALRGTHPVAAYGVYTETVSVQQVEISQMVLVTGKLDCTVEIHANGIHSPAQWASVDECLDSLRGLGGGGTIGDWFGRGGNAVAEDKIQKTMLPYLPVITLDCGPKDVRTLLVDKTERETPIPGKEDLYNEARAAGRDSALDTEFGLGDRTEFTFPDDPPALDDDDDQAEGDGD